jgi:hypothetical protein
MCIVFKVENNTGNLATSSKVSNSDIKPEWQRLVMYVPCLNNPWLALLIEEYIRDNNICCFI